MSSPGRAAPQAALVLRPLLLTLSARRLRVSAASVAGAAAATPVAAEATRNAAVKTKDGGASGGPQQPRLEWGECLNEGATPESIASVEDKLGCSFPGLLRELFEFADGQQRSMPPLLMVPKNKAVQFLSVKEALEMARYWRDELDNPVTGKYWQRAGYKPTYFPVGFSSRFGLALCVSTSHSGRVLRFTTPDTKTSLTSTGMQHLNETIDGYLHDLDDHLACLRQPFIVGSTRTMGRPDII